MKALDKKLLRGMWRSRGQALAVAIVILCGSASYICVASAHRNLLLTRDTYYAKYRLADFEILLERAPLRAASKLLNCSFHAFGKHVTDSLAPGDLVQQLADGLDIPPCHF